MKYNYSDTVDFLLDWYELNARILPWRANKNPYFIWISEIMCQQTRVEAVKFFFERFINELPTVKDLAQVDDEKLMKLWEGLGYYSRARNLKKAAILIIEKHNGNVPANYEDLLALPGIGSYTAGAIASIAFGLKEPAVDGNVLRVMKRVANSYDDITKDKVKKELEDDIRDIMPEHRPGDFNQAVMGLGATVCIPNGRPLCDKCPLMHICQGFKNHTEMDLPVKTKKKPRKIEERTIILIQVEGKFYISKRPEEGLLQGLWEIPSLKGKYTILSMEEKLESLGIRNIEIESMGEAKHIFSHIEWHMEGILLRVKESNMLGEESRNNVDSIKEIISKLGLNLDGILVSKEEVDEIYMIPTAFKHYKNRIV